MKRRLSGLSLMAAVVLGCATGAKPPPVPTLAMVEVSGFPMETLQRGYGVFLNQCGRCHEWVAPDHVKTSDWHLVIPGMCWNAGLTQADEAIILKYVLAAKKK